MVNTAYPEVAMEEDRLDVKRSEKFGYNTVDKFHVIEGERPHRTHTLTVSVPAQLVCKDLRSHHVP